MRNNEVVEKALSGERGAVQKQIATVGMEFVEQLLRKNRDYGSSVYSAPVLAPSLDPGTAILVRMSDKIKRIQSLHDQPAEVVDETILDTMRDLGSYALLWLCVSEQAKSVSGGNDDPG